MGYFSNLAIEIEEALHRGFSREQIASMLGITVQDVQAVIEQLEESDREPLAWDRA